MYDARFEHGSAGMPLVCMPLGTFELEKHHVDVNALPRVNRAEFGMVFNI
jgi:hypothetical protein